MWRPFAALGVTTLCLVGFAILVMPGSPKPVQPEETEFQIEHYQTTAAGEPICPHCGRTDKVQRYSYGLSREELPPDRISGGCVMSSDSARYKCLHCETRFGRIGLSAPK